MQLKKVVILGGGTGLSNIVKGLKNLPIKLTAIVAVSDNGSSTGRLRKEFLIPAVGDARKVVSNLSTLPDDISQLMETRISSSSALGGHAIGNLLLACLIQKSHSLKLSIEKLSKLLMLKHKVLPLSEDSLTLCGKTTNGQIIEGEEQITQANQEFEKIFYKNEPYICPEVISVIKDADLILLSAGSLLTSLLPNLICKDVQDAISASAAKIMYICNAFTEQGETDKFSVCDHLSYIEKYLNGRKIDVVVANCGNCSDNFLEKYKKENKHLVRLDYEKIYSSGHLLIESDLLDDEDGTLKHNSLKLGSIIFSYLMQN
ncbi:MAG: YvcK family protein [Clostridia bacterium]|nr:YvcK family protein [Clostridia bacterium]